MSQMSTREISTSIAGRLTLIQRQSLELVHNLTLTQRHPLPLVPNLTLTQSL